MSDIEVKPLIGTVSFSKQLSDGNYGNESAFFALQFEVDPEADSISDIVSKAKDAASIVREHVYAELGVGTPAAAAANVVPITSVERALDAFPGAQVEVPPAPVAAPALAPAAAGGFPAKCVACGGTEFWDNRPKKASGQYKSNASDFKCKNKECGKGVWSK